MTNLCTVAAPCFDAENQYRVRVFAGKSLEDSTAAKHLASLAFIQHLMQVHKFTVVDVHYYDVPELRISDFRRQNSFPMFTAPSYKGCFDILICETSPAQKSFDAALFGIPPSETPFNIPTSDTSCLQCSFDNPKSDPSCSQNPFGIHIPVITASENLFDVDSVFSFDGDPGPVDLRRSPAIGVNEIGLPATDDFQTFLHSNDSSCPVQSEEIDVDSLIDFCTAHEPHNEQPAALLEGLPKILPEKPNPLFEDVEKMNKKLERQNIRLKARVCNYKTKVQKIQESRSKIVRMARRFATSVTKFLMSDSVSCRGNASNRNGNNRNEIVKKEEVGMKDEALKNDNVSSRSRSKTKKASRTT